MGLAVVKMKIMPISPEVNLDEIKEKAEKIINDADAKGTKTEIDYRYI